MVPPGLIFDREETLTLCQPKSKMHNLQESSMFGQKLEMAYGCMGAVMEGSGSVISGTISGFLPMYQINGQVVLCVCEHVCLGILLPFFFFLSAYGKP